MCCMKVLKQRLNNNGLKQSPCNTPRPTGMNGVLKFDVMIDVLKFNNENFIQVNIYIDTYNRKSHYN